MTKEALEAALDKRISSLEVRLILAAVTIAGIAVALVKLIVD